MDSDLIQQVTSKNQFLYEDVIRKIIDLSFDVMNELGVGFLESVYHRALEIALCSSGFHIQKGPGLQLPFIKIRFLHYDETGKTDQDHISI